MSSTRLGTVVRHLRKLVAPQEDLSDAGLLERFVAGQDESAFAALVGRHGRLVWGCAAMRWATSTTPRTPSRPPSSSWPGRPARSATGDRWRAGCTAPPCGFP